jgi:hypothetical protein
MDERARCAAIRAVAGWSDFMGLANVSGAVSDGVTFARKPVRSLA